MKTSPLDRRTVLAGAAALGVAAFVPAPRRAQDARARVDKVMVAVSEAFGVTVRDICSQRRSRDVHRARVWAAYLACTKTGATASEIGRQLGNRDETIIRAYARACARQVAANAQMAAYSPDCNSASRG
ncbi:helix-turn-helix domain-containing protein [Afipia clevelandensis]|uniref:helix-turn-helix domain-containing protein n=1 Tax=Afipia clevelandensis TaxID=1034 RepID=UPI00058F723F|nr:helix-turn-helix domain-containing protein [Afipia clevelandensis]